MAEFELRKFECEGRNRSNKAFVASLSEFLINTKCKLLEMIASYDEMESKRKQLGPLMPAGNVTLDAFKSMADAFMDGCIQLMEEATRHWQKKGELQIQEFARKLEAYLAKASKKSAQQEMDELKEKAEQMEAAAKRAAEEIDAVT
jgi:hypothetical protein